MPKFEVIQYYNKNFRFVVDASDADEASAIVSGMSHERYAKECSPSELVFEDEVVNELEEE